MAKRKKTEKEEYIEGVKKLAFGSITDAIRLLYLDDEAVLSSLDKMDLFSISEIKRPKGGGMEIKFADRLKALDRLCENNEKQSEEPLSFYKALEKSAENATDIFRYIEDE